MDSILAGTAPTRSAHVLHLAPPEPTRLVRLALPALAAAADDQTAGLRTLILVEDADAAVATATQAALELGGGLVPIIAITSTARGRRVLTSTPPSAIAVPLEVAAALMTKSALPLEGVRQLIVAMPDALENPQTIAAFESVMAAIPKSATRTLVAAQETPQVESLIERHFFKARRTREATFEGARPADRPIHVLSTSLSARWDAMRKVLDEVDPPSAAIVTADGGTHADAQRALGVLGYPPDGLVQAIRDDVPAGITLALVVGVPEAATLQAVLAANPAHLVVMCGPRDVAGLRAIAGTNPIAPWVLEGPRARAESRAAATRLRLREILASGEYGGELKTLAPLLDDYDGSEIAAAALAMAAENLRGRPAPPAAQSASVAPAANREPRPRDDRPREERPRGAGSRGSRGDRPGSDRPRGDRPRSDRSRDDRPRESRPRSDSPYSSRSRDDRPRGDRPREDRPREDRPREDRPRGDRPRDDRPRGPRSDRAEPRRGAGRFDDRGKRK